MTLAGTLDMASTGDDSVGVTGGLTLVDGTHQPGARSAGCSSPARRRWAGTGTVTFADSQQNNGLDESPPATR